MESFQNHPLYKVHSLDTVMSSLWDFYRKKFLVLFIASFIMSAGVHLLTLTFNFSKLYENINDPAAMLEQMKGWMLPILGMSVLGLLFTTILQHYVMLNPVDSNNTIFSSVYKSLKYFFPYLIMVILLAFFGTFAMILGLFLLVIGMFFALLYILTISMFMLPILIAEGPDIGNAIGRTIRLSHRGFWSNLGWVAVFLLILIIISMVGSAIIAIPFTGSFFKMISNPLDPGPMLNFIKNPLYIVLSSLVNAIYLPLMPIFAAILYFNAVASEEGGQVTLSDNNEPPKVTVEDLYAKPREEDGTAV